MSERQETDPSEADDIPMSPAQAAAHEFVTGWPVVLVLLATLLVVWLIEPTKAAVAVWIVCRITIGAFFGNLCASVLIPIGDPKRMFGIARGNAIKARAIVIGAAIVGSGWTL